MSDPARWLDAGSDASDEVRALLRDGEVPRAFTRADEARMDKRIAQVTAGAVATFAWPAWSKALALAAGLGAASVVGVVALRRVTVPAAPAVTPRAPGAAAPARIAQPVRRVPARVTAPAPSVVPVPAPNSAAAPRAASAAVPGPVVEPSARRATLASRASPAASAPVPASVAPVAPPPSPPRAAPDAPPAAPTVGASASGGGDGATASAAAASRETMLEREMRLLMHARRVIASDPAETLRRLSDYDAQFPSDGQLAAEREFVAVDALRRLGRVAEARARAESLVARFPHSIFAAPTRAVLERLR